MDDKKVTLVYKLLPEHVKRLNVIAASLDYNKKQGGAQALASKFVLEGIEREEG